MHFHRGTALANVLMALTTAWSSSTPAWWTAAAHSATGNVATEEVVHMLHDMGIDSGIDLGVIDAARLAQEIVGRELPAACSGPGPRI